MLKKTLLTIFATILVYLSTTLSYAGFEIDLEKTDSKTLMKEAQEEDDPSAQFKLGVLYHQGLRGFIQDHKEAFKWFEKAAHNDHGYANAFVGVAYLKGDGVTQDIKKAVDYLEQAGLFNTFEAYDVLGAMYEQGTGVAIDLEKAKNYYKEACKLNSVSSCIHYKRLAKEKIIN